MGQMHRLFARTFGTKLVKENAAENIILQSALDKNLFKRFFAGVEAEIANRKLATAAAAAVFGNCKRDQRRGCC